MGNLEATIVLSHLSLSQKINLQGDIIGVDFGAYYCAHHGIAMKYAIGDFDSVDEFQMSEIKSYADQVIQLSPDKDDSDFEAALKYCQDYKKMVIYGGLGGRLDHQYVNFHYIKQDPRLVFMDEYHRISTYEAGRYEIEKAGFTYLSMFAIEPSMVSASQVKYQLSYRVLDPNEMYTLSNEIIEDKALIEIHTGKVLIIQSRE